MRRGLAHSLRPFVARANEVPANCGGHDMLLVHQVQMVQIARRDQIAEREHVVVFVDVEHSVGPDGGSGGGAWSGHSVLEEVGEPSNVPAPVTAASRERSFMRSF